jgi:hypothetical protein
VLSPFPDRNAPEFGVEAPLGQMIASIPCFEHREFFTEEINKLKTRADNVATRPIPNLTTSLELSLR